MAIFLIRSLENWSWKKSYFFKLLVYLFSVTDELCRLSMLHREKAENLYNRSGSIDWNRHSVDLVLHFDKVGGILRENWGIVEQNILILVLCGWNLRNTGSYFHIATQ